MKNQRFPIAIAAACVAAALPALPAQDAGSSFGHARTREMAELGRLPTPRDVAVADIVNYHHHNLPLPRAGEPLGLDLRFLADRVRPGEDAVLQVGLAAAPSHDRSDLPPLNLALVIDQSGSMADAGKMEQCKRGLRVFVDKLRREDRVALVTYADEAQLAAPGRRLGDGRWLRDAIDALTPGGSTNLHAGLMLGLREIAAEPLRRGSNRVILLTDGIANRGVTAPEEILADAQRILAQDVDLSTIGLGSDLNVELLDRLARGGRGLFHFVADGKDVAKVFAEEVEALLAPVARRLELRLDLPPGIDLVEAIGHEVRRTGAARATIALPDANRGMTAVVICRLRVGRRADAGERLRVAATLRAEDPTGRPIDVDAAATLRVRAAHDGDGDDDGDRADRATDVEVRKNHAIAELAAGLHAMAVHAEGRRWADAERALRGPFERVREQFGHGDDHDVRAVLEMAEGHLRTLRRYVERFRDL